MPKPRIAVVIRGGNVVDVVSTVDAEVYLLDYDNPVEDDHTHQKFAPVVGEDRIAWALAEWDETAAESLAK